MWAHRGLGFPGCALASAAVLGVVVSAIWAEDDEDRRALARLLEDEREMDQDFLRARGDGTNLGEALFERYCCVRDVRRC